MIEKNINSCSNIKKNERITQHTNKHTRIKRRSHEDELDKKKKLLKNGM